MERSEDFDANGDVVTSIGEINQQDSNIYFTAAAAYEPSINTITVFTFPGANGTTVPTAVSPYQGMTVGGFYQPAQGNYMPFVYNVVTAQGATIQLPPNNGFWLTQINQSGMVVGYYTDTNNISHGWLYQIGTDTVTTYDEGDAVNGTVITGIADNGWFVGTFFDKDNNGHGFYGTQTTAIEVDYPGSTYTFVEGISPEDVENNTELFGEFEGSSTGSAQFTVTLTPKGEKWKKLTDYPKWVLPVNALDDYGDIVGTSVTKNGHLDEGFEKSPR